MYLDIKVIVICGHGLPTGEPPETAQELGTRTRGAKRLTEVGIQRINAPAKGRIEIADAIVPGLRFRITDRDKRSWSLIYRIAGASRLQQRVTLGSWPAVGVA